MDVDAKTLGESIARGIRPQRKSGSGRVSAYWLSNDILNGTGWYLTPEEMAARRPLTT